MRIAMVSWLKGKPVPPVAYGGIERCVQTLTMELLRQGHQVTLIAPKGSAVEGAVVIETDDFDTAYQAIQFQKPDIVHSHECWALESVVRRKLNIPCISTTHVNHAIEFSKNVVYLSYAQRESHASQLGRDLSSSSVIRVPTSPLLKPKGLPRGEYLLYLGSIAEHKGVHRAAQLAEMLDRKLIVAGPGWGDYYDLICQDPVVEIVGEVQDPYRSELLEQAYAVCCLFGNEGGWSEPGAGVVQEAGAFNTPVAGLPNGCIGEIVVTDKNGWLGRNVQDVYNQMTTLPYPSNPGYFARTEWSAATITRQYVELYEHVCNGGSWG